MPLEPGQLEGKAPREPHLALLVNEAGQRVAIPIGASLWIVEDPTRADKIFPLTLKKVSHKALTFVMSDDKGALVEYEYRLLKAKPLNREALQRLQGQADRPIKVQR